MSEEQPVTKSIVVVVNDGEGEDLTALKVILAALTELPVGDRERVLAAAACMFEKEPR